MNPTARRKVLSATALLGLLAALVPAAPASAAGTDALPDVPAEAVAAAAAAGTGPVLTDKCAAERQRAVEAAKADGAAGAGVATCSDYKPAATRTSGVGLNTPVPSNCPRDQWGYTRTTACLDTTVGVVVYVVQTGQIIGGFDLQVRTWANLSPVSHFWQQEATFTMLVAWGQIAGTFIRGDAWCAGACSGSPYFPDQWFYTLTATASASVSATATLGPSDAFAKTNIAFWFVNPTWLYGSTNALVASPSQARCDTYYGNVSPGCVFPHVRPIYNVYSFEKPSFARHVALAIGYTGRNVLTRMTSEEDARNNGNRACPGHIDRPTGYSCDEYPFRSTYEGAYKGGYTYGRTFEGCQITAVEIRQWGDRGGYNICMIPVSENSGGGGDLGAFYRSNRVLDGEQFEVVVN